jgi:hypothetical protein
MSNPLHEIQRDFFLTTLGRKGESESLCSTYGNDFKLYLNHLSSVVTIPCSLSLLLYTYIYIYMSIPSSLCSCPILSSSVDVCIDVVMGRYALYLISPLCTNQENTQRGDLLRLIRLAPAWRPPPFSFTAVSHPPRGHAASLLHRSVEGDET